MFDKILIANRGEIAVRILRACRALGVRSVAIYSQADEDSLHARLADVAVACGPARASESYLDAARIVEIAKQVGADAVHPGYGFLSENAEFAEAVAAAGITFIGPSPDVIRRMGLKVPARELMTAAGVPVVPGGDEIIDPSEARKAAADLGYPVLVKASAGGGGRGMRRVDRESELEAALERARSEAEAAFGNGAIYLEKCLVGPRHIEIQIVADGQGRVVHLGERECSIQRRHQKLVEEAPAHGMTDALRTAMGEAAVRAARAVEYRGVGTVEFLVDARGDFYFLEMNTRIQVEHPVTECVTGIDLVSTQIRVAAGEHLDFSQDDVSLAGHAIEVRIYAEDPDKKFIPSPGRILGWLAPAGEGVRLDSGFEGGQLITPHYDPMIAKLIVSGGDRQQVLVRLAEALEEFWIAGIRTGLPFLRRLVANPVFLRGAYDTGFIEAQMQGELPALGEVERELLIAAVGWRAARDAKGETAAFRVALPRSDSVDVEVLSMEDPVRVRVAGREVEFAVDEVAHSILSILAAGQSRRISLVARKAGGFDVALRDRVLRVKCDESEGA
ncbi:MAG: acetyl-CoA carboxylase biotin carboxylase subunit [Deltaproteobacteria bacterium]|nr:acetyl-CoA carboxylase biotin carboxylase subunit [Deltaproteobacteria bacterium]